VTPGQEPDSETWAEPDPAHEEEADLEADRQAASRLGWS
jgi:hypothetical protein